MKPIANIDLSTVLSKGVEPRLIEPHIFSVLPEIAVANTYDTQFGNMYDRIACNPVYNRLIWGYSIGIFATIIHDALRSSKKGYVLDLGCGSLAFTAKTYLQYCQRPVILADQSLKMLQIAKARLLKANGTIPDNMVFLHTDALQLPFRAKSLDTIISENLLHCLDDTEQVLKCVKNILTDRGRMYFTTLIKADRFADRYLEALANKGKLVARSIDDHLATFKKLAIPVSYQTEGNMTTISTTAGYSQDTVIDG